MVRSDSAQSWANRRTGSLAGARAGSVAATTTEGVLVNPNGRQLPLEPPPELRELVERAAGLGLTARRSRRPSKSGDRQADSSGDAYGHFSEEIKGRAGAPHYRSGFVALAACLAWRERARAPLGLRVSAVPPWRSRLEGASAGRRYYARHQQRACDAGGEA